VEERDSSLRMTSEGLRMRSEGPTFSLQNNHKKSAIISVQEMLK